MGWIKEPLLHFALAACLLFTFHEEIWPAETAGEKIIQVSREDLVQRLQYQNANFGGQRLTQQQAEDPLANLDKQSLKRLVDNYVYDEARYREAIALGLDQNDRAIKLRLAERAEQFYEQINLNNKSYTEAELVAFFNGHISEFEVIPAVTFKHLFFKMDTEATAKQRAVISLESLRSTEQMIDNQLAGDRFLYNSDYVERSQSFVAAQFGSDFADQVFSEAVKQGVWSEPLLSQHGYHLVRLQKRSERRVPEFDEVKGPVINAFMRDKRHKDKLLVKADIVAQYQVKLPDAINKRLE